MYFMQHHYHSAKRDYELIILFGSHHTTHL
jgi:hypothetical protein